jgi:hypothetical protein
LKCTPLIFTRHADAQATIPHLTRSSLHRLFQRHEISRLPAIEGETGRKKAFKRYPIGYFCEQVHASNADARHYLSWPISLIG